MTVDDEGKKAEVQPGFLAQLQAILNVLPAYTWYAPPSGSLTFVSKRQADLIGLPNDHPLRLGISISATWDTHNPLLHPYHKADRLKSAYNSLSYRVGYQHDYCVHEYISI